MVGADEAFCIEFADVFRARWTDGAPAVLCDDFQAADGCAVAGRVREGGFDFVARKCIRRKRFFRKTCDFRFLFGCGGGVDPFIIVCSKLLDESLIMLRGILACGCRDFRREEGENDAVFVRRPAVAVETQEGGSRAFFAAETDGFRAQAGHKPFETNGNFTNFAAQEFADAVDHGTADERFADLCVRWPLRARLEKILNGDGEIVVGIHEASGRRHDAVAVEIWIVAEGDVELVFQTDEARHGVFGGAIHADFAIVVNGHEAERGIRYVVANGDIEAVTFSDGCPETEPCATERVCADGDAGFGDGFHVDDVFQVVDIRRHVVVLRDETRGERLGKRHAFDVFVVVGKILIRFVRDDFRDIGVRRAAVRRIVFEATICRRIMGRRHDDAVRRIAFVVAVVADDGVGDDRRGCEGAIGRDSRENAVGR